MHNTIRAILAVAIIAPGSALAHAAEPQAEPTIVLVRGGSAPNSVAEVFNELTAPRPRSDLRRAHVSPPALLDLGPADASTESARSLNGCKSQWRLADLNGDGVLDAREVAHYNSALRSAAQAPLSDDDRPNEMGFIAECTATTTHE
jgi:hypothetical protein